MGLGMGSLPILKNCSASLPTRKRPHRLKSDDVRPAPISSVTAALTLRRTIGNQGVQRLLQNRENAVTWRPLASEPTAGRQLTPNELRVMGKRFGRDLDRVRVHTESTTADAIGAKAFASGHHIWFGRSHSPTDHQLLAHELAHVVEQTGSAPRNERLDGNARPALRDQPQTAGVTQFDFEADVLRELQRLPPRRERLRVLFRGLSGNEAGAISDRLHKRKAGDLLSERFYDILKRATRLEMLTIVDDVILDSPDSATEFCKPYTAAELRALKDHQADRAMNELVNDYIAMFYGEEVADVMRQYLSPVGSQPRLIFDDPAHKIVKDFIDNDVTRARQAQVLTAFKKNLKNNCPKLAPNVWTDVDVSSVVPRSELDAGFSFSGPTIPTTPGILAGGISGSDFGMDSRSISGKVQMLRVVANGVTISVQLRTKFRFVVKDAFDFCPGAMGGFPGTTMTIPMSRLEASGSAADVPFEVHYDGPEMYLTLDADLAKACFP